MPVLIIGLQITYSYGAPLTNAPIDTLTCRLVLGDNYDAIELRKVLVPLTNSGVPLKQSAGGRRGPPASRHCTAVISVLDPPCIGPPLVFT